MRHTGVGFSRRKHVVIGNMILSSTLPPPPRLHEPDVLHALAILQNGYTAAQDVVNLGRPDPHQAHFHQERVQSELIPLLDAIVTSTSDSATISWCCAAAASFADLYNWLTRCETSVQ